MVFANGNAGNVGNAGGFGTPLAPPATSKNVISVGATTSVRLHGSGLPAGNRFRKTPLRSRHTPLLAPRKMAGLNPRSSPRHADSTEWPAPSGRMPLP